MLKKTRRINKEEFPEIMKSGKVFHSPILTLRVKEEKGGQSRFAFVISSKIAKKAVTRNLFKRRCRAIASYLLKDINDGFLAVFMAKNGSESASFSTLRESMLDLLKRAKML